MKVCETTPAQYFERPALPGIPPVMTRFRGKHYSGWIQPSFSAFEDLLEHPEELQACLDKQVLLNCEGRQIHRLHLPLEDGNGSCFSYFFRNRSRQRSLRRVYAFQLLRLSRKLTEAGIGTFEVLAAVKKNGELLNWHSFVIAREIQDVRELASAGRHAYSVHSQTEFSLELAGPLGKALAELHEGGFFHGDLKTRHVLVDTSPIPRFFFVDLEKCLHLQMVPAAICDILAARDLIQLFCSSPLRRDATGEPVRERFLQAYFESRQFRSRRRQRVERLVDMYGTAGGFQQGKTVLANFFTRSNGRR